MAPSADQELARPQTAATQATASIDRAALERNDVGVVNDGKVIGMGHHGEAVKGIQEKLGMGAQADGKYGPDTVEAVKTFQRANGLKDDGVVGSKTWGKLSADPAETPEAKKTSSAEVERREGVKETIDAKAIVKTLRAATTEIWGTDEATVINTLKNLTPDQLGQVRDEWNSAKVHNPLSNFDSCIKGEFSGSDLETVTTLLGGKHPDQEKAQHQINDMKQEQQDKWWKDPKNQRDDIAKTINGQKGQALTSGTKGDAVRSAATMLKEMGKDVGNAAADGKFKAPLEAAVREFQKEAGLTPDGIVGKNTAAALVQAHAAKTQAQAEVAEVEKIDEIRQADKVAAVASAATKYEAKPEELIGKLASEVENSVYTLGTKESQLLEALQHASEMGVTNEVLAQIAESKGVDVDTVKNKILADVTAKGFGVKASSFEQQMYVNLVDGKDPETVIPGTRADFGANLDRSFSDGYALAKALNKNDANAFNDVLDDSPDRAGAIAALRTIGLTDGREKLGLDNSSAEAFEKSLNDRISKMFGRREDGSYGRAHEANKFVKHVNEAALERKMRRS